MIAHTTINDLLENRKSLYFTIALSILYVLPLLIANVYYQDDHARAMYAHGWSHDGRFINNWINKLITLSNFKFSLYPVTLILSALLLGVSGYVLCGLWKVEYTKNLKWSSLLLLISPFYLANLPYRYDALFMSLSIFVLIIPYAYFYKKKHFLLISILCFYLSLGMYEPSVSIYLMVGVVFIYQFLEKNDFRKAFIYIGLMIIACLVGYLFYHFTKLGLNINAYNERIQLVFFQPNYQFLIKEKLLMFYEIYSLLYNDKYYYMMLILLIPIISVAQLIIQKKSFFYISKIFLLRGCLLAVCFMLFIGPNVLIKADYLPLRALPAFGVFTFILVCFLREFKGAYLFFFRLLLVLNTLYCFNLMAQTANALYNQKQYQEMFVYDLNSVVRTYDVKKISYKGEIGYARKSYKIFEQFPFIKTIVQREIGASAWFSQDVLSFSGIQEIVEFIPYDPQIENYELVFKSYVYNLYIVHEGHFLIEFN